MTNEERRKALSKARSKALEYAEMGGAVTSQAKAYRDMAIMWAAVAEAMKVGENREADGVVDGDAYATRDEWRNV